MPKDHNDDDRVPKHPKATDDYIKVQKWEEEFTDFLLSKGASRTARCGEAPRYPNRVEEGLLSTDKDIEKMRAREADTMESRSVSVSQAIEIKNKSYEDTRIY